MYLPLVSIASFLLWDLRALVAPPNELALSATAPRKRCTAHDACWPSASIWQRFNSSVSSRLIASRPSAATCHDPGFSAAACENVRSNWTSSDWRTDQVGAYAGILWELGDQACFPWTPRNQTCEQGLVAPISLDARHVKDIQAAVKFASEHDLYLTVKNTGHDHLGRSSGDGSFAIWTHNMKGREWHDKFIPSKAPADVQDIPAVTLQPGEQWLDVYHDAGAHNVIVAGGAARTVGAAGGYVLGGGHSPFSFYYGLAADNVLEMSLVTPRGEHVILNEYTDPEYFWAVRGGGGSAWGVITSVTYKTHPSPKYIQVAILQANMSTPEAYRKVYTQALKSIPRMTDAGYTGYGSTTFGKVVQFIFLQPNGTIATLDQGFTSFNKIVEMNGTDSISVMAANFTMPTWVDYTTAFLRDPNIATNIQDATRLLTPDVLTNKANELVDLAARFPHLSAGHNFSKLQD
jgi:FAD binding domain